MIVENGSVTMDLDLNRLNGISSRSARPAELQFAVAANSFFSILCLTIFCAALSRGRWRWSRKPKRFQGFLCR